MRKPAKITILCEDLQHACFHPQIPDEPRLDEVRSV